MPDKTLAAVVKRFYGARAIVQVVAGPDEGSEQPAETSSRNKALVCGDEVLIENRNGSYFITETLDRRSEFFRTDGFGRKKIIAVNVDQILLVIAPKPEPHQQVIDRYWVAARNCDIPFRLICNKVDLPMTPYLSDLVELYKNLDLKTESVSAKTLEGLESLRTVLYGKTSVLVGQSGAGKSSLVNSLAEDRVAEVGLLSEKRAEGRHTTTTTNFFDLSDGGRILDSPGIREFGLDHYDQSSLQVGFVEISDAAEACRFRDCTHNNTPGCAVVSKVESGAIDSRRFDSYLNLLSQITA